MKLRNSFATNKRELFRDLQYRCGECGGNGQNCGGTEAHHIKGRCSSSVFNLIVLCKKCHSKVGHTFEEEKIYLQKTAKWVFHCVKLGNYRLDDDDKNFLHEHRKYYE